MVSFIIERNSVFVVECSTLETITVGKQYLLIPGVDIADWYFCFNRQTESSRSCIDIPGERPLSLV